jgi:hypothetical protein
VDEQCARRGVDDGGGVDDSCASSFEFDPRDAEIIIAAECLWLRELLAPFADTACEIMRASDARRRARRGVSNPGEEGPASGGERCRCVLSFRDRSSTAAFAAAGEGRGDENECGNENSGGGGAFVPVRDVVDAFTSRGCVCALLHERASEEDDGFRVHVFSISFSPAADDDA